MNVLKRFLLKKLIPNSLKGHILTLDKPPLWWSPWFGKCEYKWAMGRYEVTNWKFENALKEAQSDLKQQQTSLKYGKKWVSGLEDDVKYLTDLIELMETCSQGSGI